MTQHLVLLLVCLMGIPAFAQQARVIKTKGYQAIVQFPEGEKPRVGQVIDISADDGISDEQASKIGTGARANSLTGSGSLGIVNSTEKNGSKETTQSVMAVEVQGRYGWNFELWEAGPLGQFSMSSGSEESSTMFSVGGFFDWNLVPNRPGTVFVYGAGASGYFGQLTESVTGGTSTSSSAMGFFGGAQMKWFMLNDAVAFRGDAGISYEKSGRSNAVTGTTAETTELGFKALAGISFYF